MSEAKKQNRTELMCRIKDEVLNLKKSLLCAERIKNKVHPVIGEGSHTAQIMFIGEAPGKNEALTGRPFCGASGKVLDELLEHISVNRKDVYITNIVKDRPPQNRDPLPAEIEMYAPFLDRQILIIKPKVIATLGRFSMEYVMKRYGLEHELGGISKIRGKLFETNMDYGKVYVVPLYHPAVALYNGGERETLKKDIEILKKIINDQKDG